jgi:hypothetical protein
LPPGAACEAEITGSAWEREVTTIDPAPELSQTSTKPWTLAHAILGRYKLLTSSIVTIAPNGSFNHISVLNVGRSAVLSQWHDDGGDDSLTLSRVPNWLGAESAKPSVILPACELEPIKIVFDKSADAWSKVSSRAPSAFPLMIDRDLSSLPAQSYSFAQISLPRNIPANGLSQHLIESTGGATDNEGYQSVDDESRDYDYEEIALVPESYDYGEIAMVPESSKSQGFRRLQRKLSEVNGSLAIGRKKN